MICILSFSVKGSVIGGETGAYLRYPVGAIALGMGGTASAQPQSLSPWWNCAFTGKNEKRKTTAGFGIRSLGQTDGFASFEFKVPPRVGMGLMILYRGDPFLDNLYDDNENRLEHASFTSISTKIAISYIVSRKISAGFSIGILYEQLPSDFVDGKVLYTSSTGIGSFDFAVSYKVMEELYISLVAKDIGAKLNWSFESAYTYNTPHEDQFLPSFILASSYTTRIKERKFIWNSEIKGYIFDGTFKKLDRPQGYFFTGCEWQYWNSFFIRAGIGEILINGDIVSDRSFYFKLFSPRITAGFSADMSRVYKGLKLEYGVSTDKIWAGIDQQLELTISF